MLGFYKFSKNLNTFSFVRTLFRIIIQSFHIHIFFHIPLALEIGQGFVHFFFNFGAFRTSDVFELGDFPKGES